MTEEIFVVALPGLDGLDPVSFEAAFFAKSWSEALGAQVRGVTLQRPGRKLCSDFAKQSGLHVYSLEHESLSVYNAEDWLQALDWLVKEKKPFKIIIPHTATGWDFAPRLAVRTGASCSTAVTAFHPGGPEGLWRRICGGKLELLVKPGNEGLRVITVMPGVATPVGPVREGVVEALVPEVEKPRSKTLGHVRRSKGELDLGRADVIVAAGRGLGGPEHLGTVKELASCFDRSAVGASRPVVDSKWLPLEHQVGQTGQTVRPKLYLALGISGAIQHTTGMKDSDLVVAVNKDPKAPIFNTAHLGVIKDLHEFLPILTSKIKKRKSKK